MDYPTDLDLNSDKDIYPDDTNDLALVGGKEQLQQSVAIDVMNELSKFVGGRVTGKNVGLLEERVKQSLNDDPQVGEILSVEVQKYDRRNDSIVADIKVVENDDFTLELST